MAGFDPSDKRKKGKTPLGPFLIALVLVVGAIAIYFVVIGETPESEPETTGEIVQDRPTGAGTVPEEPADPLIGGATDELDDVEPAAPGEDQIPAQEVIEDVPAEEEETFIEETEEVIPSADDPAIEGAEEEFLLEEDDGPTLDEEGGGTPETNELVVDPNDGAPIDPDGGADPFVPTDSGPEGRDEAPLTPE
ncbi:hypothetical protein [Tranquillimonas alkanivorans]|uniref:Uncharacterized protein n=1 Tax=Tranquillimonas alkanivorans TaxID=441119 RepID=A0A1I5PT69_9RHOB|nr:hypothetical protein [Tranquillimonas alkanivorans]SFP37223.1 hypothetical protein SAMN04488047_105238 [Tranquillimonas alkanivorans]